MGKTVVILPLIEEYLLSKKDYIKKIYKDEENHVKDDTKIIVEPKTLNQKNYLHTIRQNTITICKGPSGSGKTILAVGFGLQSVQCSNPKYEKIIVIRSAKEACGEDLGAIPGEIDMKMMPYLMPVIDNLRVFLSDGAIECLIRHKKLEALPIGYCRGRSLNNCYVILEEAQNTTEAQVLCVLTRIGENSKLVICGDPMQSDLKEGQENGLDNAIDRLSNFEGIGICYLDHNDIVRNPLISEILYRYDKLDFKPKESEEI